MAYTDVSFQQIGVKSEHYFDVADAADALPVGNIIAMRVDTGAYRPAVAANPTDIVMGVCTLRWKAADGSWMKRIHEGRFMFSLEDNNDAIATNRYKVARVVTATTISVDAAATGPVAGICDEFRGLKAICRMSGVLAQTLNLGIALPEA